MIVIDDRGAQDEHQHEGRCCQLAYSQVTDDQGARDEYQQKERCRQATCSHGQCGQGHRTRDSCREKRICQKI